MRRFVALGMVLTAASLAAAGTDTKPAAIPDLIRQLSSNDFHVRQRAARQLGNLGLAARDAVPALSKALHDNFPEVRASAAKALGQIGRPAMEELIKALKDRDSGVRKGAAGALGQAGLDVKKAVPALIEAIQDKRIEVRLAVIDALGEMGMESKEAAPQLARLFHDPSTRLRKHVRLTMARIGPSAIEPLCKALNEEKTEARLDAIKTIALFGPIAKKALPALRRAMKDEDHRIRAAAAEAMGKMELEGADAVPELLAALNDKKLSVQREVVTALVLLTAAGVPDLLQKVREADRKMRWVSPEGLAKAQAIEKAKKDLAGLLKDLRDKDPQVRGRAAIELSERGPKAQSAIPVLLKYLENEDPQIRLTAALVIARIERLKAEHARIAKKIIKEVLRQQGVSVAFEQQHLRAAMSDPLVQARVQQIVMAYILSAPGGSPPPEISQALDQLGPEAIPALVAGINLVAANGFGGC